MKKKEVGTVCFWAEGKDFTRTLRDFIEEGSFYQAYTILKDRGAPEEMIKGFFLFTCEFTGDTRKDNFSIVNCKPLYNEKELEEVYVTAMCTLFSALEMNHSFRDLEESKDKNVVSLLKVLSIREVRDLTYKGLIRREGYELNPSPLEKYLDGVILSNGDCVGCEPQDHRNLYPFLCGLYLVESGSWTDENTAFHITSGQLSGGAANKLEHPDVFEAELTEAQTQTLFKYRKSLSMYGGINGDSAAEALRNYVDETVNKGGKYNNLLFLRRFYADQINLPNFSLEPLSVEKQYVRTSPKLSIPGLLHSKMLTPTAIDEIKADFEKYKDVVGVNSYLGENGWVKKSTNELHWFYQEFIEGVNGVAHYRGHRNKEFTYAVSEVQGDVVAGKKTSGNLLPVETTFKLRNILHELSEDLDKSIQVEFVFDGETLYIVQLRILKNEPTTSMTYTVESNRIIANGHSFSAGSGDFSIDDVLVVDSDCESEALIGKKALIVREKVEFSHALALSKSLDIPSLYGVGNVQLPKKFKMNTTGEEGLIFK